MAWWWLAVALAAEPVTLQQELQAVRQEQGDAAAMALLRQRLDGATAAQRAELLSELGALQASKGQLLEARVTLQQALDTATTAGQDDRSAGPILLRLGTLLLQLEDPAWEPYLERVELAWRGLDVPLEMHRRVYNYLTVGALQREDYRSAEVHHARAEALLEPDNAMALGEWRLQLATILHGLGDYRGGRDVIEQALAALRVSDDIDPVLLAVAEHQAGSMAYERGEVAKALAHMRSSVAIRREHQGEQHPQTLISILDLGTLTYVAEGDLVRAQALMEHAYQGLVAVYGADHPYALSAELNLAKLVENSGNDAAALPMLQHVLAQQEARFGPDHPMLTQVLEQLTDVQFSLGAFEEASAHAHRAFTLKQAAFGAEHPEMAEEYLLLAQVLPPDAEPAERIALLDKAADLTEAATGPDSSRVARFRLEAAQAWLDAGDAEAAAEALELSQGLRDGHPTDRREWWLQRGDWHQLRGEQQLARKAWWTSHAAAMETVQERIRVGSSRERLFAFSELHRSLGRLVRDTSHAEENWRAALAVKGAADRVSLVHRRLLREAAADEDLQAELSDWRIRAAELASTAWRAELDEAERAEQLRLRSQDLRRAERALLDHTASFSGLWQPKAPQVGEICAQLPPGVLLVDLFRLPAPEGTDYIAWTLTGGTCTLEQHVLADAASINVAAESWREALASPEAFSMRVDARGALLNSHLAPLWPAIASATELWVVADDALATVPWGALPEGEHYLLERVPVRYLDSALDVLEAAHPPEPPRTALIVGAPDYGSDETATHRSTAACVERSFPALPHSAEEATAIQALLARQRGSEVALLLGAEASEEGLRSQLGNQELVHLATHGFFADTRCARASEPDALRQMQALAGYSPLSLSGLALAGANLPFDPLAPSDGIWTAEEVASLPLDAAQLVVLSACETGRGTAVAGQGVQGLRRAFTTAGAHQVVMTLWPVEDAAAAALMEDFYRRWLRSRGDPTDALRASKLARLARNRSHWGESRPADWAGWVTSR